MAEEVFDNQRPVVIVAVVLAALTAAGLWYFFVFRQGDFSEMAEETPVPVIETAPTEALVIEQGFSSPTPLAPSEWPTTEPTVAAVSASAATGPAQWALGLSLILTLGAGLILRRQLIHLVR